MTKGLKYSREWRTQIQKEKDNHHCCIVWKQYFCKIVLNLAVQIYSLIYSREHCFTFRITGCMCLFLGQIWQGTCFRITGCMCFSWVICGREHCFRTTGCMDFFLGQIWQGTLFFTGCVHLLLGQILQGTLTKN